MAMMVQILSYLVMAIMIVMMMITIIIMMITRKTMMMFPGHAGCSGGMVGEATPAVLILVLLFITPSRLDFWPFVRKVRTWGF